MSEEKATVPSSEQKKNKKVIVALSGVVVVLAVAVGVMALSLLNRDDDVELPTDGRATFVTKDNVEKVREELSKPVEDASYTTSMTIDWEFYDGQSASTTAEVSNVEANTRTVYFDVNLESGELVYSSPYLPVGSTINGIILDVDLDAGDYPAVVTYHLVDDEHNEVATVSVAITIHVLN